MFLALFLKTRCPNSYDMKITFIVFLFAASFFAAGNLQAQSEEHNTLTLTTANFDKTIEKGVVLVDFWATWCPPCVKQGPVIDRIADSLAGRVKVGKVDTDKNSTLTNRFAVSSIPTTIIFVDGVAVNKGVGFHSYDQLMARLKPYLKD